MTELGKNSFLVPFRCMDVGILIFWFRKCYSKKILLELSLLENNHLLLFQVDGKVFSGEAKSKKEAKKIAAIKALAELYEIQY